MNRMQIKIERYKAALRYAEHTNQLFWQVFSILAATNGVLLGFLLHTIFNDGKLFSYRPLGLFGGLAGFIVCICWIIIIFRQSSYNVFRTKQARRAEPAGWNLLHGDGKKFGDGEKVKGDKITWPGTLWGSRNLARTIAISISVFYLVVFIISDRIQLWHEIRSYLM